MIPYRIGLVVSSSTSELTTSDLLLSSFLTSLGHTPVPVVWDDTAVHWHEFDFLIVRSCWDYHSKLNEFTRWLNDREVEKTVIWNPIPLIRWNLNKEYLLEFQNKNLPVIPSKKVNAKTKLSVSTLFSEWNIDRLIVKPLIGASSVGVQLITMNRSIINLAADSLIQPFFPEIALGELSLIFFKSHFSHAVIKQPKKSWFSTDYIKLKTIKKYSPSQSIINQAAKYLPSNHLYARVDGIIKNDTFYLMELECIEPELFFDLYPNAVESFATALFQHVIT